MTSIQYDRPNGVIRILDDAGSALTTLPIDSSSDAVADAFNALPPSLEPGPEPNWQEFTNGILNENGYVAAHQAAADSTDLKVKFAAAGIFAALVKFQSSGDFVDYLTALSFVISAADDPVKLVEEFIGLAQRCHLPADFIAAVGAIIPQSPPE